MEIKISDDAIKWFQQEMEVSKGDSIRFYVRYGGSGNLQPGFSLGVAKVSRSKLPLKRRTTRCCILSRKKICGILISMTCTSP
ncbi:HesB/YadR/YfhF family protein [Planococcus salinus]|uniref:HesB/YadR/YfhF family protein n=1 Tax=Planococcus salinus TaxID=1848460 RepID=UPI00269575E0